MKELPHALKLATVWLLIGTALFLAIQAWQAQQRRAQFSAEGGVIEIRRSADGHFHWPGQVNGVAVEFLVDTGATRTALPAALGERAGLQPEGRLQSDTAGGTVQGQVARATLALQGGVQVRNMPVALLPDLRTPLLGMDVLGRLQFSQADGVLRLRAPDPATP